MAPSLSSDPSAAPVVTDGEAELLLDIVETTLAGALAGRRPSLPALPPEPGVLHARVGAFVTLTVDGHLNGCVGRIEGDEPLAHAVAGLALSAAFADPRLPALRPADAAGLTIELSLLSPLAPVPAGSSEELLGSILPGHHGVVVRSSGRQGLFLPVVWEQLPDPRDFLHHLWLKAGLAPGTWPPELRAFRFTAERHERRLAA